MKTKRLNFIIIVIALCLNPLNVSASNLNNYSNSIEYDLNLSQIETYSILDDNNELIYITITPQMDYNKIANGSYKVTYTKPKFWSSSFIVSISNNKFVSASSISVKAITGTIKNYALKKVSSTQITLEVFWSLQSITIQKTGMKAYISNNTLKVSAL